MGCPQALPKSQSTRQGGGRRSVPGTLAWQQAVPVWLPQSRKHQVPEVAGGAAPADRGLLGRRGSGGRGQERAWAPWGTWRRGVTLRGTSARSPRRGCRDSSPELQAPVLALPGCVVTGCPWRPECPPRPQHRDSGAGVLAPRPQPRHSCWRGRHTGYRALMTRAS